MKKDEQSMQSFSSDKFVLSILKDVNYQLSFTVLSKPLIDNVREFFSGLQVDIAIYESINNRSYLPIIATNDEIVSNTNTIEVGSEGFEESCLLKKDILTQEQFPIIEDYLYLVAIPLKDDKSRIFSLLIILFKEGEPSEENVKELSDIIKGMSPFLYESYVYNKNKSEQKRQGLLLQVTKKFHSSMNVGEVLSEIIFAMGEMYPSFNVKLLLSREWEVSDKLPIVQIQYMAGASNSIAEKVFLTGKIQIEDIIAEKCSILYVPLRGKQGVYGVMNIQTPNSIIFPDHEIEFIEMLADIGGNALENAELYQQSRNLINDLQLINQTSHELNSNLRLSETIKFMTEQIRQSFGADEVGYIMFLGGGAELQVLEGSTEFFFDDLSKKSMYEISEKVKREKEALFIGDVISEPQYSLKYYRSLLVVPMIQTGILKGMVVVLHQEPYHFSFDNFKLLQSLIHHSTLAFTNSMLHEELEKLVITDHLTKLYSRNYLDQKIQESMYEDAFGCFLLIDIDNFKNINDTYGHQVGDDIIIQVANIMKRNIRDVNDIAARWGGEELAIYLPKVDLEIGKVIANRIVKSVAVETSPRVTISCGISFWSQKDQEKSLKRLFNLADRCLYVAKESGKNKVVCEGDVS